MFHWFERVTPTFKGPICKGRASMSCLSFQDLLFHNDRQTIHYLLHRVLYVNHYTINCSVITTQFWCILHYLQTHTRWQDQHFFTFVHICLSYHLFCQNPIQKSLGEMCVQYLHWRLGTALLYLYSHSSSAWLSACSGLNVTGRHCLHMWVWVNLRDSAPRVHSMSKNLIWIWRHWWVIGFIYLSVLFQCR